LLLGLAAWLLPLTPTLSGFLLPRIPGRLEARDMLAFAGLELRD